MSFMDKYIDYFDMLPGDMRIMGPMEIFAQEFPFKHERMDKSHILAYAYVKLVLDKQEIDWDELCAKTDKNKEQITEIFEKVG